MYTHEGRFMFMVRGRHTCTGLTGSRKGARSLSACLTCRQSDTASVRIKDLCHGKTNKAQGWPERHVYVFHGLIRDDVYSRYCSRDRGCTSQLSVSACQRVKPACENIYKIHLPLVRRHKWLPCGLLINRPVYLLEHNKLATNTDKELKNYKYCNVMKSLNLQQVFYKSKESHFFAFLCSWRYFFWHFLLSHTALLIGGGDNGTLTLSRSRAEYLCVESLAATKLSRSATWER